MIWDALSAAVYLVVWLAFAALYIKWFVLSPPPVDQSGDQALAARPPEREWGTFVHAGPPEVRIYIPRRGGSNYLAWLHVRLFLEQQGGRS